MGAILAVALAAGAAAAYWTARRRAQGLQKELEAVRADLVRERIKIETLVQNITDGLVITNLRGEVLFINAEAVKILGAKEEEVTAANKGLFELVNKDQFRMKVQRILKSHTHSEVTEMQIVGDDGHETRYYKTYVKMFHAPDGDFGVSLTMRDVTSEKNLDALKEELFLALAHDLRAPLFAIQGYLRLLEKSLHADNQQGAYVSAIAQSSEKLTLFVTDTLDSARLEAGNLKLSIAHVNAPALIRRVIKLFSPLASEKGIKLELNLPEGDPLAVEGDERLLERVFYNLMSNAVKFTPKGGTISLEANRAGPDQMEFSVTDSGPGVPEDQKKHIFEKYRQLHPDHRKGGFGLGLNICKKIIELHRGTIWVDSESGNGSQFIIRMPAKQPLEIKQ